MTLRPVIRVRGDFVATAAAQGHTTKTAIAQAIGVAPSNVGRVLDGKALPGNAFIAGALVLGPFDELFEAR